ncbi:MAG: hypothetical protein H6830_02210 [Planctomycetes bacterium]|nr:hypothetical protein [Planctomycetota bacterium]MCB9910604.1 hypothetical protein [Planctomycetota bacterium]
MRSIHSYRLVGLLLGLALLTPNSARAQAQTEEQTSIPIARDSGWVENTSGQTQVIASYTVRVPGAAWLRLYFGPESHLGGDLFQGSGAYLVLTSHADGSTQILNARHLEQWQSSSAYFNGDAVQVDLVAAPGTGLHRVLVQRIDMAWGVFQSQCGATDDRVLSNDPRQGRLLPIGCTGWLINDCGRCALTAGHCTGNISVLEFNVPLSTASGGLVHPPASDQYAIDPSSVQSNGGLGVGDDWGYFGTFPNSNTGLTAAAAQGATYILASAPAVGSNTIRVTGYGTDSTPQNYNQVQQTHVGPFALNSGTQLGYVTDTEGGNSGSPVIWEQTGEAIGIHTHGGCSSGYNSGTNLNHPGLQAALAAPTGVCGGVSLDFQGSLPDFLPPGVPVDVQVVVEGGFVPGSVLAYWRNGAGFQSVPMTPLGGGLHQAQLPAPNCGAPYEIYFSADTTTCGLLLEPGLGAADPFTAGVGVTAVSFGSDFETDQGWLTENLGATSGAWQRGIPVNDPSWAYDPVSDADGSGQCYLTENALGNTDVDGGTVRLTSPAFALGAGSSVAFDYYLYLSVPSSTDHLLVEMSHNGLAGPWVLVADVNTSGGNNWRSLEIPPSVWAPLGIVPSTDARVRFTVNDADTQSIVEAGIDGFQVGEVSCGGPVDLLDRYCGPAAVHSGGVSASIRGYGSPVAIDNDLTLIAEDLPVQTFAYFLVGSQVGFVPNPGGSQGTLCLGGTLGRYNAPLEILNSGATGSVQLTINLTALPTTPNHMVVSGETWFFQCWFRDLNPGQTSNFTDGLQVSFF